LDYITLLTPCAGSFLKLLKKHFNYAPGQALKEFQELENPRISGESAHEGDKFVSLTHQLP